MSGANITHVVKHALFVFILVVLFIPLLQETTHFKVWEKPLEGSFSPVPDVAFNWAGWFDGDYQGKKNDYLKQHFGLRSYYLRLSATIDYWLLRKVHIEYVVVGKKDYLFEEGYIDAYFGRDFVGDQKIQSYTNLLLNVQDTLQKQGKLLLVVFAPGKASYYPEKIPDKFRSAPGRSNYQAFVEAAKKLNINHIDFNAWTVANRHTSALPLYPQYGIHWSYYASLRALDSMTKYIGFKMHKPMPQMVLRSVALSDSVRSPDNDIAKALNLWSEPSTFKMAYPEYTVRYDPSTHQKLNLLVEGDSFWWQIYGSHLPDSLFATTRFWYYNNLMYPESYNSPLYVRDTDYPAEIRKADVIVLMHTENTLANFGNGFLAMCDETFFDPSPPHEKIRRAKEYILTDTAWYNPLKRQATRKNLNLDSMLTRNAIYVLESQNKIPTMEKQGLK